MNKFEKQIEIRWSDVDQNRHVRHSVYYDYTTHVRVKFLAGIGFDAQKMNDLDIGPVLFKEECSFIKELQPNDTITVNILNGNKTKRTVKWVLHQVIFNQQGEKCAHVTVQEAWLNLTHRKITRPPVWFLKGIEELPTGEAYEMS